MRTWTRPSSVVLRVSAPPWCGDLFSLLEMMPACGFPAAVQVAYNPKLEAEARRPPHGLLHGPLIYPLAREPPRRRFRDPLCVPYADK